VTQGDSNSAAGVREGDVLAGKYRVEKVLGAGGMGVVVAARHIQLDTKVALKFLLPEMLSNPEAVSRFAREARAAVKITSEHVARVLDVGTLENGAPYLVMEFLDGGDLAAWLQQRGALPIEQAVEFVLQACVAVADAHGLGIVHRDLKPANLFCVRRSDGQLIVKVLDFGISKVLDLTGTEPGMSMTRTSAVLGSPLYMSPEQMQTPKDVDATTDIWALGIILYELLTGRVPFDGATIAEVAVKAATQAPPPMRTYRPDMPPGLEGAIIRCLEKDRRNRYRNVAELAVALVEFGPRRARASVERISGIVQASGLSASALAMPPSPPIVGTQLAPGTVAPVGRTAASQSPGARKGNILAVSLGALAVACTVAAIAFVGRAQHPSIPAQAGLPEPVHAAAAVPPEPPAIVVPPAETTPPTPPPLASAPTAPKDLRTARPRTVATGASTSQVATPPPTASPPPAPPAATTTPSVDPLSKLRVK
jgi:eukaryotic-like serine/threonine-protein kinase